MVCVKYVYVVHFWALFSTITNIYECRLLNGYKFAVYTTAFCPNNKREWIRRSIDLNCTDRNGYMCYPNDEFTGLLEFCYIYPRIKIQGGICLFLDSISSIVKDYNCSSFTDGCPDAFYYSDRIYEHKRCLTIKGGCFLAEPNCNRIKISTYSTNDNKETTHDLESEEEMKIGNINYLVWIAISCIIFCVIFLTTVVIFIIKKRSDKVVKNNPRNEEIHYESLVLASYAGLSRIMEECIPDLNVNQLKTDGKPLLFIACQEGNKSVVQLLLQNSANINLCSDDGTSPLSIACYNNHLDIVELLLKKGANVNLRSKNGTSPLFIASNKGHSKIVKLLLDYAADVNLCFERENEEDDRV